MRPFASGDANTPGFFQYLLEIIVVSREAEPDRKPRVLT
jgi:hypothetical protein